jgi:hypothetical protein
VILQPAGNLNGTATNGLKKPKRKINLPEGDPAEKPAKEPPAKLADVVPEAN